jgi:selenocysteine lyase/cysteine desulfurase
MVDPAPGSNVVFDESAYPSAAYPWMLPPRAHVERRFVQPRDGLVHLGDLAEAVDDRTVAVSISHVSQRTGFRHDLAAVAELAHSHGALLLVDAMVSVGAVAIDVREQDVDFLSCGAMKWLLGLAGVGFFYAASRHLDRMPPHAGGPGVMPDDRRWSLREFRPKKGAERFHVGMPNLMGLAGSTPGLEILLETGMDTVEAQVLDLSGYCSDGMRERGIKVLTPAEPAHRAGVVAAVIDDAGGLWEFLYQRGVDTYYSGSLFRVDPHVFNNRDDIDRLLEGVDAYLAQG